jgi:hypothetical protein
MARVVIGAMTGSGRVAVAGRDVDIGRRHRRSAAACYGKSPA